MKSGGLGLAHLFVCQAVLSFFFFKDTKHVIIRAVFQTKLAIFLPSGVVSSVYDESMTSFRFLKEV